MKKNNIIVTNEYFKANRNIHDEEIIEQIKLINDTDNILTNYCENNNLRSPSNLGRNVEGIKVEIKKLRRDLVNREKNNKFNEMDEFLLKNGEGILSKAEEALKSLKYIDYMGLIKRSMKEHELCIGKGDESNLRKNEFIEIGTLKKLNYNLKEEDVYDYLVKIKKYVDHFNKDYYINEFINIAELDDTSRDYLRILLTIPRGSLKEWYRYINGKKDILASNYLVNIKRYLEYEE